MDNKEKVLKVFMESDKPLRPGDVAEKTGLEGKIVSDVIKSLKDEGKIISPKRCFYSLP